MRDSKSPEENIPNESYKIILCQTIQWVSNREVFSERPNNDRNRYLTMAMVALAEYFNVEKTSGATGFSLPIATPEQYLQLGRL